HDLAAGSGIGVIYKDAQADYDQVRWATQEVSDKALRTLASFADTRSSIAGSIPLFVFNPLGWERSGWVEADVQLSSPAGGVSVLDAEDHVLPSEVLSENHDTHTVHLLFQARNVPSIGYEVLHFIPEKRAFVSDLKVSGTTLEN